MNAEQGNVTGLNNPLTSSTAPFSLLFHPTVHQRRVREGGSAAKHSCTPSWDPALTHVHQVVLELHLDEALLGQGVDPLGVLRAADGPAGWDGDEGCHGAAGGVGSWRNDELQLQLEMALA